MPRNPNSHISTRKKPTLDEDVLNLWRVQEGQKFEDSPYLYGRNHENSLSLIDPKRGLTYPIFEEDRTNTAIFLPPHYESDETNRVLGEQTYNIYERNFDALASYLLGEGQWNGSPLQGALLEGRFTDSMQQTFGLAINTLGELGVRELAEEAKLENRILSQILEEIAQNVWM